MENEKKNRVVFILIIALALIIIGLVGYIAYDKLSNKEKDIWDVDDSKFLLQNNEFQLSWHGSEGHWNDFITSVKIGDIIYCHPMFEVYADTEFQNVEYTLVYGKGLELINEKLPEGTKKKGNTYTVTLDKPTSITEFIGEFAFKVVDKEDLTYGLRDVKYISVNNNYYKVRDYSSNLVFENTYENDINIDLSMDSVSVSLDSSKDYISIEGNIDLLFDNNKYYNLFLSGYCLDKNGNKILISSFPLSNDDTTLTLTESIGPEDGRKSIKINYCKIDKMTVCLNDENNLYANDYFEIDLDFEKKFE